MSVFFFCFILCALCVSLFDFAFVRCFAAYTRTLHKFGVNSASISGRLVRRGLSRTMLRENNDTRMCRFLCFVCIGRFWLSGHRLHKLLKSKSFSNPNHCHCILNANVFLVCLVQIGQSHAFIHAFFWLSSGHVANMKGIQPFVWMNYHNVVACRRSGLAVSILVYASYMFVAVCCCCCFTRPCTWMHNQANVFRWTPHANCCCYLFNLKSNASSNGPIAIVQANHKVNTPQYDVHL